MNASKVFKRQLDIVKPSELDFPILMIGAGGIGSWATLALAKMGCSNISVIDFDKVEEHNLPSQLYKTNQLGQDKVVALTETIKDLTGVEIKPIVGKFEDKWNEWEFKVIISAVDSLNTRQTIWEKLSKSDKWEFYIDARMGGELLRLLVVAPKFSPTVDKYERILASKTKPAEEVCTAKAIVYNTFLAGGLIANAVKKFAKKENIKLSLIFDITQQQIL